VAASLCAGDGRHCRARRGAARRAAVGTKGRARAPYLRPVPSCQRRPLPSNGPPIPFRSDAVRLPTLELLSPTVPLPHRLIERTPSSPFFPPHTLTTCGGCGSTTPMAPRAMLTGLVVAALAAAAASGAAAHSSMTAPSPISRDKHCKVDFGKDRSSCPGPCPVKYLKPFAPVAKTYRGARFPVRWYKNNHQDGFVRWTVVPLDKANDAAAHAKGAFQYGCYSAGRYQCSAAEKSKHCTFDNMGVGYKATVDVPKNLPDGDYMLGWTWYGGQNKPSIRTLQLRPVRGGDGRRGGRQSRGKRWPVGSAAHILARHSHRVLSTPAELPCTSLSLWPLSTPLEMYPHRLLKLPRLCAHSRRGRLADGAQPSARLSAGRQHPRRDRVPRLVPLGHQRPRAARRTDRAADEGTCIGHSLALCFLRLVPLGLPVVIVLVGFVFCTLRVLPWPRIVVRPRRH